MKRGLDVVVMIASLSLIAIIIVVGWDYAQRGRVQTIIGLEAYSVFWAYIAMPIGGLFAVMGIIGNFFDPKRLELETAQWRAPYNYYAAQIRRCSVLAILMYQGVHSGCCARCA